MQELVTPKQVARAIGVSESSLKRWCDSGVSPSVRTAGGHRRIPISGVISYLRSTQQKMVAPELLGLPATSGGSVRVVSRGREQLQEALLEGDEDRSRQIVLDLYLSGQSLSRICDEVISGAFSDIGDRWACNQADVYEERRACEIAVRILHELRMAVPPGDPQWMAMGGTLEGDQYMLPTTMVELVLRTGGWNAQSLGTGIPVTSLAVAIREQRPRLFWLSVSHIPDIEAFVRDLPQIRAATEEVGVPLVLGGFALTSEVRERIAGGREVFCDSMQELEAFAARINPAGAANILPAN